MYVKWRAQLRVPFLGEALLVIGTVSSSTTATSSVRATSSSVSGQRFARLSYFELQFFQVHMVCFPSTHFVDSVETFNRGYWSGFNPALNFEELAETEGVVGAMAVAAVPAAVAYARAKGGVRPVNSRGCLYNVEPSVVVVDGLWKKYIPNGASW